MIIQDLQVKVEFPEGMLASGGKGRKVNRSPILMSNLYKGMKEGMSFQKRRNPEAFITTAINSIVNEAIEKYRRTSKIPVVVDQGNNLCFEQVKRQGYNAYWGISKRSLSALTAEISAKLYSNQQGYQPEVIKMTDVLKYVADRCERMIKNSIMCNINQVAPNQPEYAKRKGNNIPFVNTGKLVNNIHIGLYSGNRLLYKTH